MEIQEVTQTHARTLLIRHKTDNALSNSGAREGGEGGQGGNAGDREGPLVKRHQKTPNQEDLAQRQDGLFGPDGPHHGDYQASISERVSGGGVVVVGG